ncbi:MAG: dihydrofolate reductase [Salinisphaera sp.]|nr:dihydrofolate reductase [Salinisphaera sp.]
MDENGLIGAGGVMPWHLPSELRHFRRKTLHKPVLMGRRTFAAIGGPLKQRDNLVLSRDPQFTAAGVQRVASVEEACAQADSAAELVVIGGAQVYALALPAVSTMYLTRVHAGFAGDTWFPDIEWRQWEESSCEHHPADADNRWAYSCMEYQRRMQ